MERIKKNSGKKDEKIKSLEFRVKGFKYKCYNNSSLLTLDIIIEGESFETNFLLDSYDIIYYPEFRGIDRYGSNSNSDAIVNKFINSFRMKVNYFAENYSKSMKEERGINTWDVQEWWQANELDDKINDGINDWIQKNIKYLSQCDISGSTDAETFNSAVEELRDYLIKRQDFEIPTGFGSDIDKMDDTETLELMLSKAIKDERFEDAARIRDKIEKGE